MVLFFVPVQKRFEILMNYSQELINFLSLRPHTFFSRSNLISRRFSCGFHIEVYPFVIEIYLMKKHLANLDHLIVVETVVWVICCHLKI